MRSEGPDSTQSLQWRHPTYVFFREHPGEAQVPGHLGLEKPIFPEVGVKAICCRRNLEENQTSVHEGWNIQMFCAGNAGPSSLIII